MPITIIALACFLLGGAWAWQQAGRETKKPRERARKILAWLGPLLPPLVLVAMLDADVFTRGWAVAVLVLALAWLLAYAWYILMRCRRKDVRPAGRTEEEEREP